MNKTPSRLPRLLLILPGYTSGGAEKQAFSLAAAMRRLGMEVTLWALPLHLPVNTEQLAQMEKLGIPCHVLRSSPTWKSPGGSTHLLTKWWKLSINWNLPVRAFLRHLPDTKADIIVPFTARPCQIACLVKDLVGARRVFWNHRGGDDDAGIRYDYFLIAKMMKAEPEFITNNSGGARFLERTFGLEVGEVKVIPNAFEMRTDAISDTTEEDQAYEITGPVLRHRLVHIANHFPEKDPWTLIRAMALLKQEGVAFHLDMAGGFPIPGLRKDLESYINSLGLQEEIRLLGACPAIVIRDLLGSSHIGLLSSGTEGMPNAIMEYMQHALPIVASDIPGIRDSVGPHQWPYLFPPGDAIECSKRILRLLEDTPARINLGQMNAQRLNSEFNSEKIFGQWNDVLMREAPASRGREGRARRNPTMRKQKLKIGWLLVGNEDVGSSRIHGLLLHRWLQSKGHESVILQSTAGYEQSLTLTHVQQLQACKAGFDVVIFQRVHQGLAGAFARNLKAVGTKVAFFAADRFDCAIIGDFNTVLTASEALRGHWIDAGLSPTSVHAVPDAIETPPTLIKQLADHRARSNLKLGWLGAEGHWNTVQRLKDLVCSTPALADLELVTISNHPQANIMWRRDRVWHDLMNCDIGLVPVDSSNPASLAKSNNRVSALQAIGLPVVCARIPAYEASIAHGKTGFYADTDQEWIRALTALRDPELRKTIAVQGHARAWSLYHPDIIGVRFESIIHGLLA